MPTGRKPVPAEVRRQRGQAGRPLPVIIGGRVAPPMPGYLTPMMQTCWKLLVKYLMEADAMDAADAGVLEAASVMWGRARQARKEMVGQPIVIVSKQGPVANRALEVERQSWKEFRALAESLPLSPWGRARLGLKGKPPADQVNRDIGLSPRQRVQLHAVANDE